MRRPRLRRGGPLSASKLRRLVRAVEFAEVHATPERAFYRPALARMRATAWPTVADVLAAVRPFDPVELTGARTRRGDPVLLGPDRVPWLYLAG